MVIICLLQRTLPLRHKEIYGINVHPTVKFALDFGMALISDKIRKRVRLHSAVADCEIDKSLLPKEYGGTMPMKEMIGQYINVKPQHIFMKVSVFSMAAPLAT